MTHVLITGGAGFIGSSLADRLLLDDGYSVTLVDNLLTGEAWKVPKHPRCKFVACDVNRYEEIAAVMTSHAFDYVFHYAAVVGVKRTIDNPVMVLNDIEGIRNILQLSKNTGVRRVFFSSSSEVYGEPVELPQHEERTPLNSRLPYAVVKNVGESYCRSFQKEYGLNYTIFRFFNTYGPKQSTDFVISKFIRLARANEPIPVYGNGGQTRTFCFITDNTDCTLRILEDNLMINEVINIGSEKDVTILELAELIIRLTGSQSTIEFLPPLKEGDMTRRKPDASKMKAILKRDLLPLEAGIKMILEAKTK
ncbi:MAG: NAD-dependent epimerase/dehydratase family protein [Cyclobacteriaceae bacterium]|nr:NAD-dependent epimerase/dehydratase family protein [Cyclobacteriaceae bacterium]